VTDPSHVYAVVLAAGASRRFAGPKLLAPLDGRPLLQHVVDVLASAPVAGAIVVLGTNADAIEHAIDWRGARRVRNERAAEGLSTSLKRGIAALPADAQGALIVLGDQPRLSPSVARALLGADLAGAVAAVPVYERGGRGHPVLLMRQGFGLVGKTDGDEGLGRVLAARPDLVVEVPVPGENPDVDTRGDLERLAGAGVLGLGAAAAERAWAERVEQERAQVERLRETPPADDFYAPIRSVFVADPRRRGDATVDAILALAEPGETWLDVGAGAGRFALPLALRVGGVIAVEPSPAMRDALESSAREHGIGNVTTIPGPWPMVDAPSADVALIAHLGYDIADIGPFLDALERSARRLCVAVLMERAPVGSLAGLWAAAHGEPRIQLPALPELLALLLARRRLPEIRLVERESRPFASREELHALARHQLFVAEGSEADARLRAAVDALPLERDGSVVVPGGPRWVGVVSWASPSASRAG
jgi:CTP:molybdopterin cytidylyltransferase MocA/SAM-dependent methyltransferase